MTKDLQKHVHIVTFYSSLGFLKIETKVNNLSWINEVKSFYILLKRFDLNYIHTLDLNIIFMV